MSLTQWCLHKHRCLILSVQSTPIQVSETTGDYFIQFSKEEVKTVGMKFSWKMFNWKLDLILDFSFWVNHGQQDTVLPDRRVEHFFWESPRNLQIWHWLLKGTKGKLFPPSSTLVSLLKLVKQTNHGLLQLIFNKSFPYFLLFWWSTIKECRSQDLKGIDYNHK